ncbi:MAG: sterol desaturase family protein [Deltaproteobacteria bacterium]|nr:sterol desaturase family protein [Deltaproteobacteria bacterium]
MAFGLDLSKGLEALFRGLLTPFEEFGDPGSRHFGLALFVGGLWAFVFLRRSRRAKSTKEALGIIFDRRVWLHPSALLDYQLLFANALLRPLFFGVTALSGIQAASKSFLWMRTHFGPGPLKGVPLWLVEGCFSVSVFVVEDFFRFLLHLAFHRFDVLWVIHKVHHSAQVMTPFTVHRVHPIESAINRWVIALVIGVVGGVWSWACDAPISGWTILGVDALGVAWNVLGAALRHSEIPVRYPTWLEHLLISPAQHQIHHGEAPDHHRKNFGSTFAIWDWMFGTLQTSDEREKVHYGLPAFEEGWPSLWEALAFPPFRAASICLNTLWVGSGLSKAFH